MPNHPRATARVGEAKRNRVVPAGGDALSWNQDRERRRILNCECPRCGIELPQGSIFKMCAHCRRLQRDGQRRRAHARGVQPRPATEQAWRPWTNVERASLMRCILSGLNMADWARENRRSKTSTWAMASRLRLGRRPQVRVIASDVLKRCACGLLLPCAACVSAEPYATARKAA